MTATLYIAAKAPRVGLAKTRLGRSIGPESAVALYKAFLQDLAARFADAPFECGWYLTPPDAWPEMAPLIAPGRETRVLFQGEGDWTERQRGLFRGAARRGEDKVVLAASDSPHIPIEVVARAFDKLDRRDLVLGPTFDGGYYLIGMRHRAVRRDILRSVPMSTDTVLDHITTRAMRAGLSVGWVEATFDVDEAEDLEHLRQAAFAGSDLQATRAVLEKVGLLGNGRHATMEPDETQTIAVGSAMRPVALASTKEESK